MKNSQKIRILVNFSGGRIYDRCRAEAKSSFKYVLNTPLFVYSHYSCRLTGFMLNRLLQSICYDQRGVGAGKLVVRVAAKPKTYRRKLLPRVFETGRQVCISEQ
jgi:hypothetical protein